MKGFIEFSVEYYRDKLRKYEELEEYPCVAQEVYSLLKKIKKDKIEVVESGCSF